MNNPNFDKLFEAAALQMLAAFMKSSAGNRPDEIGAPREMQVKKFLKEWLPAKYGISKGYLLNSQKQVSKECDIVIYDNETCPKFIFDEALDVRFFPKNDIFGTLEIKSTLNNVELKDALEKIKSANEVSIKTIHDISFSDEWEDVDIKLAENLPRYIEEDDYVNYKAKIKKKKIYHSNAFSAIFAYQIGHNFTLQELKAKLILDKNAPDFLLILDKGLLIKVDELTLKRYNSLKNNKISDDFKDDYDITIKLLDAYLSDAGQDYILLENTEQYINLMNFYMFIIDYLNNFRKISKAVTADIISVFKK